MVGAIVRRDLTVVLRARAVAMPIIAVGVIFFVVFPALAAFGLRLGQDALAEFEPMIAAVPESLRRQLGDGSVASQVAVYLFEYQFATLFLIVPLMVASVIAADSFAGEKERKTLESLLYTPTTDLELYVAKLVGPWLAAMAVAIIGFALYAIAVNVAAAEIAGRVLALTPLWLLVIGWLSPAVAALGLGVMVIVSARVRGFQEAYQLGGAVVLPLVLLFVAQVSGILFIDALLAFALGVVVWLVAAAVLWLGYRGFRRERLLLSS
jgi:ABC-type Na+ efflux pump permease subunit